MTAPLVLDNLLAWAAQAGLLVVVGALAALTLSHPRARLIFWQGILGIVLLLPAVEPWHQPPVEDVSAASIAISGAPVIVNHPSAWHFQWRREYLLWIIACGAVLRFSWIGVGLVRLRRHRLDARMLTTPPVPFSNPRVRWFISNSIGGPVTFGFFNPTILLPARVAELPADLREAIAHHELAHVRRGDWLFVLMEESIRSVLWFHPAIWFVLSRIQLAREQVVDAEVVGLTRDRERYLDALVAVAAQRLLPDVAPAPLFLKKRQLAMRVAAVLEETRMSKPRMFLSFTTVCSAALIAARVAVWMFPLQAPAQTAQLPNLPNWRTDYDGAGVVVEPGAKILHRSPVFYPSGVTTTGTVIVESSVNAKGEVTDAHVVSGPDELRNAVLSSVLTWHFSPDGGLPPTVQSSIRFDAVPAHGGTGAAAPPVARASKYLKSIDTSALPQELAEKVSAALPIHVGDTFGNDDVARVRTALNEVDEHLVFGVKDSASDVTLTVTLRPHGSIMPVIPNYRIVNDGTLGSGIEGTPQQAAQQALERLRQANDDVKRAQTAAAELPPPAAGVQRIQVGGNVQSFNLVKKVVPIYPPLAKQARLEGSVQFTALIDRDGNIADLQLVSGDPLLVESALAAVRQWQYKPTLLNGTPAEVITQIDVNYTLSQ